MSRGELTRQQLESISRLIPDLTCVSGLITPLSPDFIAGQFPHESKVPIAAVCLDDARQRMSEINLALHEFHAHRIWYRSKKKPPDLITATWLERFFLDDAALRIYAAWQHLILALRRMEGISKQDLKRYRPTRGVPRSSVSLYLEHERPQLGVSTRVSIFECSPSWSFVVNYRNTWVHEQPPTIEGLGMVFHRERRWKPLPDGSGMRLAIGGGDKPKHTIDDLHKNFDQAARGFIDALRAAAERYHEILSRVGITIDVANCSMKVQPFS